MGERYETQYEDELIGSSAIEGLNEFLYNIFKDDPELRNKTANILADFQHMEMTDMSNKSEYTREDYFKSALMAIDNLIDMEYYRFSEVQGNPLVGGAFSQGLRDYIPDTSVADTTFWKVGQDATTIIHEGLGHGLRLGEANLVHPASPNDTHSRERYDVMSSKIWGFLNLDQQQQFISLLYDEEHAAEWRKRFERDKEVPHDILEKVMNWREKMDKLCREHPEECE